MADLKTLADAVIKGNQSAAVEITKTALEDGTDAKSILDNGLIAGMDIIGERFGKDEIYIPEVTLAARAMKAAMEVLEPEIVKAGIRPVGKFVIGTVQGDLHDIGKNIVAMMLKGAGFEVTDLGVDISPGRFVEAIVEHCPEEIGMSALLTTVVDKMKTTIDEIQRAGYRDVVKVMVGGTGVTQAFADKVGADGYAENAAIAVKVAKDLLNRQQSM